MTIREADWDALVLGGGMAGLSAAVRLRRLVPAARILLVDAEPWHTLRPKLPEAVGGFCDCAVRLPLHELLGEQGVAFQRATVTHIDPEAHRVRLDGAETGIPYRTLLVALGSVPAVPQVASGPTARALPLWSFEDACGLRRRLSLLATRARRTGDASPLSVAVIGGGFVGIEIAAAASSLLRALVVGTSLTPRVTVIERGPRLLPWQPRAFANAVAGQLAGRGVAIATSHEVIGIDAHGVDLDNGERVAAVTVVWAGGVRAHPAVATVGDPRLGGRIPVSMALEARAHTDIYVAGDDAVLPIPQPLPPFDRSAASAAAMGRHAAQSIARQWTGRPARPYHLRPTPLLVALDPHHVLGLDTDGRMFQRLAPLLEQAALARHIWRVGGARTLAATFRETFWEPWRRRAAEVECPAPDFQEAAPVLWGMPRVHP